MGHFLALFLWACLMCLLSDWRWNTWWLQILHFKLGPHLVELQEIHFGWRSSWISRWVALELISSRTSWSINSTGAIFTIEPRRDEEVFWNRNQMVIVKVKHVENLHMYMQGHQKLFLYGLTFLLTTFHKPTLYLFCRLKMNIFIVVVLSFKFTYVVYWLF